MSIAIMSEVFASDLPTGPRFVLLAYADNADDEGVAYPSARTVAGKTGNGESTVRRHVAWLVEQGIMRERPRFNDSTVMRIDRTALRARAREAVRTRQSRPGEVDVPDLPPSQIERGPESSAPPLDSSGTPSRSERLTVSRTTREPPASGGTRDARPGEQPDLGLDVEPVETPAPERKSTEPQTVVAAYVEAYRTAHAGQRPIGRDVGKIGRDARAMLGDGESLPELIEAARTMGHDGRWNDLARQVALDRTGGRAPEARGRLGPASVGRPGKFDDMPAEELIER